MAQLNEISVANLTKRMGGPRPWRQNRVALSGSFYVVNASGPCDRDSTVRQPLPGHRQRRVGCRTNGVESAPPGAGDAARLDSHPDDPVGWRIPVANPARHAPLPALK